MTAPFTGYRTAVRPEWIDYNGHMTDWAYAVVCSAANELFLDHLDLGASYRGRTGCALYTVAAHHTFHAAVGPETVVSGSSVVAGVDTKRLRVRTQLAPDAGPVAFTGEYLYLHVDTRTSRVVPLPESTYGGVARGASAGTVGAA